MIDPYAYYNLHMNTSYISNANRELSEIEEILRAAAEREAQAKAARRAEWVAAIKQTAVALIKRAVPGMSVRRNQQAPFGV